MHLQTTLTGYASTGAAGASTLVLLASWLVAALLWYGCCGAVDCSGVVVFVPATAATATTGATVLAGSVCFYRLLAASHQAGSPSGVLHGVHEVSAWSCAHIMHTCCARTVC